MHEFIGGFLGSISGMFLIGVVLTMAQGIQHAKQSKKFNEVDRESVRVSHTASKIGEA